MQYLFSFSILNQSIYANLVFYHIFTGMNIVFRPLYGLIRELSK